MEYTYDDIITAKDVISGKVREEDIIGKKGWCLDTIPLDMDVNKFINNSEIKYVHKLEDFEGDLSYPFVYGHIGHLYFLPEKEESLRNGETVQVSKTFSIGEKVVVSKMMKQWPLWCNSMDNTLGLIGTVQSNYDEEGWCSVYFNDLSTDFCYPKQCLERVSECKELKYVPFDLSKEEDRTFLRDKWIKTKTYGDEFKILSFRKVNNSWIADISGDIYFTAEDLLRNFTFLDGMPCEKEVEE